MHTCQTILPPAFPTYPTRPETPAARRRPMPIVRIPTIDGMPVHTPASQRPTVRP